MLVLKSFFCFSIYFFSYLVNASPISLDVKEADRLVVKGTVGDLQIITGGSGTTIQAEVKSSQQVRLVPIKKDNEVILEVEHSSGVSQDAKLVVRSLSRPVEIYWDKGSVSINDWKNSIHFSGKNAKYNLANINGSVRGHLYQGQVNLTNFKGSAHLASFKAGILVNGGEGPLKIENFSGESKISNLNSDVEIIQQSGVAYLNSLKGSINIDNGEGDLDVDKFSGVIKGKNSKGVIKLKVLQADRIEIKSDAGKIDCILPEKAGHRVYLKSETGIVQAPEYLSMTRQDKGKTVKGELRGSSEGAIKIVSNTGNINLR